MARSEVSHWRTVDALFAEALERPADERTAFLRARCGDDPALYQEIIALLSVNEEAGAVLGESAAAFVEPLLADLRDSLAEEPGLPQGTRVGPYRIERLIGRGGMGNVYLAERADGTFTKQVALKLIRRGMDTDEVLARFRRERQLLAGLDHPNIARLLDGGASDDGRPYLVMELVEGEPITRYADRLALSVEQRLDLFAQVAKAVQAAHQRLIVHRDLKPSNILVTTEGQVKLLDFGVARLIAPETAAEDPLTRAGLRLVTPEYAAPEQLRGEPVTTSADVYSLGVVLFELLVGRRPAVSEDRGLVKQPDEITIPTRQPRGSELVDEVAGRKRSSTQARLGRRLRGDLDTILLTALHEDTARRYPSVEAFLDDIQRHLRTLPINARRDSVGYRSRRFVRRHRFAVGATVCFIGLLLVALAAVALQQRETAVQRDRAELELAQKMEVTAFLTELFGSSAPEQAQGDTLTSFDLLARGAARLETDLADQPVVQGHLLHILSTVNSRMGDANAALALAERALEVRTGAFGSSHPDVAESVNQLASVLMDMGRYDEASAWYTEALEMRLDLFGPGHPMVAESMLNLGLILTYRGSYVEAEPLLRQVVAIDRNRHGDMHADVATALNNLAILLYYQGKYGEAEAALAEALGIRRVVYGAMHPRVAITGNNLAAVRREMGDLEGAEALLEESLSITRHSGGNEHPDLVGTRSNLARVIAQRGRPAEAEQHLKEAIRLGRTVLGVHPELADALANLGGVQIELQRYEEALGTLEEALAMNKLTRGDHHPRVALVQNQLATVLAHRGDFPLAEAHLRGALALQELSLPADHDDVLTTRLALARLLGEQHRTGEALEHLQAAYGMLSARDGADHPQAVHVAELLKSLEIPTQ